MDIKERLKAKFLNKYKVVDYYYKGISPVTLEVHPSYMCNFNCTFCIDEFLKNVEGDEFNINCDGEAMLTKQNMIDIIDSSVKMGIKGIILSGGGEPTMNKNTELLCQLSDKNDIVIGMFTNGSLLNDRNIKTYVDSCSFIRFSFDDYNAKSYAKTKGTTEKSYKIVLDNIKKLVAYKKESGNTRCRIGVDFILGPDNVDKMSKIWKESQGLGADYLQFCDCVIPGYEFDDKLKGKILDNLETIYILNEESGMDVVYEPIQSDNDCDCKDCKMINYIFLVGADGTVEPCPHMARHRELAYGNINDTPLEEIWKNKKPITNNANWEYCRFREQNKILRALEHVEHSELL